MRELDLELDIRYNLNSMGVVVDKPIVIYEDNHSAYVSATDPGISLNKKNIALVYHYVREHVANKVVEIRKIPSKDNYADVFTKGTNSVVYGQFFHELLSN